MSEIGDRHKELENASRAINNYQHHRDQAKQCLDEVRIIAVSLGMDQRESIHSSPVVWLTGYLCALGYSQ